MKTPRNRRVSLKALMDALWGSDTNWAAYVADHDAKRHATLAACR
jgi:hypothetical protein